MRAKVSIKEIILPVLASYAVGLALLAATFWFAFSQGETFKVLDPLGKETAITFDAAIALGIQVCIMALGVTLVSLVVSRPAVIAVVLLGVVVAVGLTLEIGSSAALLWLAFIIGNIGLYRGRARLYVLSLGIVLFISQIYNAFARTESINTAIWLIASDVLFAAPIFYVIWKYIPAKNSVSAN